MFNKLLLSVFIAVTFAITVYAQIAPQPVFSIDCPTETVIGRDSVSLTASTDDEMRDEPAYDWSLSSGTITTGQGTKSIEIDTRAAESITATLEINGDAFETITTSCTFEILRKPRKRLAFEFDYSTKLHLKMIVDSFFSELEGEPNATGYLFIFPSKNESFGQINNMVLDHIKVRQFDQSRLMHILGETRERSHLQFWLVPEGTVPMTPDDIEKTKGDWLKRNSDELCTSSKKAGSPECPKGETSDMRILKKPAVFFTPEAREANVQGFVRLSVTFRANGQIGEIEILKGLGYGLSEAAIAAARKITFKPAMKNGIAVDTTKQIEYSFHTF